MKLDIYIIFISTNIKNREYLDHSIHSEIKGNMTSTQTTPKQSRIAPKKPKRNQNSMRGGRVWRSNLTIQIDLKRYENVIRKYKEALTCVGLKFPTTTKSFT